MAFRIGKNFHIVHMTGDLRQLDLWYYDLFSVGQFIPLPGMSTTGWRTCTTR